MDPALDDSEHPVARPFDKSAARALGPAHRQFPRTRDRLARGLVERTFVQGHRHIGAELMLDLDRALRRQLIKATVEMRAEGDARLGNGAPSGERHDLEAA